jgi:hypothetical protein
MLQDVPNMVRDYFAARDLRVVPDSLNGNYYSLTKLTPVEKKEMIDLKLLEETQTNEDTSQTRKAESPKRNILPPVQPIQPPKDVIEISSGESKKNVPRMQICSPTSTPN